MAEKFHLSVKLSYNCAQGVEVNFQKPFRKTINTLFHVCVYRKNVVNLKFDFDEMRGTLFTCSWPDSPGKALLMLHLEQFLPIKRLIHFPSTISILQTKANKTARQFPGNDKIFDSIAANWFASLVQCSSKSG